MITVTKSSAVRINAQRTLWTCGLLFLLLCGAWPVVSAQDRANLNSVSVSNLPDDSLEVRLQFDRRPPQPTSFAQAQPARISLDLRNVRSRLATRRFETGAGNVQNLLVLETRERTRLLFTLAKLTAYRTRIEGNALIVWLGRAASEAATAHNVDPVRSFSGDLVSLSFQNIEVRSVLQLLADENNFNLVASDAVSGNITLQLQDVPWDHALDLILQTHNLDKRLLGNVLYVAPAQEIATQEQQALAASRQAQALAPLQTEYLQVNYADANDMLALLGGSPAGSAAAAQTDKPAVPGNDRGVLSSRGSASVDKRTNIIIIRDVAEKLTEVRELLSRLDVPVRQVLIEARIVNVSTDFGRDIGIRWGGAGRGTGRDDLRYGGTLAASSEQQHNRVTQEAAMRQAVAAGEAARVQALREGVEPSLIGALVAQAVAAVPIPTGKVSFPEALAVDLGVESASASSFAVGFAGSSGLIELELSALESSGKGEVIARPKVTTQDKVTATIESGVRIPYQAQAGGTAGGSTTEFVDAVLSLEVTPQITPDGRIIMQLDIHQDSVAPGMAKVPAINTNAITTSVLVENGDTIVLGGVFREETTSTELKTPLLGDIPYLGRLFKRSNTSNRRTELLIFITPRIIAELNTR